MEFIYGAIAVVAAIAAIIAGLFLAAHWADRHIEAAYDEGEKP